MFPHSPARRRDGPGRSNRASTAANAEPRSVRHVCRGKRRSVCPRKPTTRRSIGFAQSWEELLPASTAHFFPDRAAPFREARGRCGGRRLYRLLLLPRCLFVGGAYAVHRMVGDGGVKLHLVSNFLSVLYILDPGVSGRPSGHFANASSLNTPGLRPSLAARPASTLAPAERLLLFKVSSDLFIARKYGPSSQGTGRRALIQLFPRLVYTYIGSAILSPPSAHESEPHM